MTIIVYKQRLLQKSKNVIPEVSPLTTCGDRLNRESRVSRENENLIPLYSSLLSQGRRLDSSWSLPPKVVIGGWNDRL
jgi:hypothetical protein